MAMRAAAHNVRASMVTPYTFITRIPCMPCLESTTWLLTCILCPAHHHGEPWQQGAASKGRASWQQIKHTQAGSNAQHMCVVTHGYPTADSCLIKHKMRYNTQHLHAKEARNATTQAPHTADSPLKQRGIAACGDVACTVANLICYSK